MLWRMLDGIDRDLEKYVAEELFFLRRYYGIEASSESDVLRLAIELEPVDQPVSVWLLEAAARIEHARSRARREKEQLRAEYARPFR